MFIEAGHRVRLIHTGAEGIVTAVLSESMVNVLLGDGIEIPVSIDDLKMGGPSQSAASSQKTVSPVKVIEGRFPVTNQGLQVGFETSYDMDGNPEKYRIFLLNDSPRDVVFNYLITFRNGEKKEMNGLSQSNTAFSLGEMLYDKLNESPILDFECWPTSTYGKEKQINKTIKIKAKQFFKKVRKAPILKGEAHLYELIAKLKALPAEKKEDSIYDYTKRLAESRKKEDLVNTYYTVHNIKDKAAFSEELDLHIEKLTDKPQLLNSPEKLHLQIQAFEQYIEEAYAIGFDRVFVIHGLGKGRLRDIIASRLIRNDTVASFKNDYHAKYGFGATEVIFKK